MFTQLQLSFHVCGVCVCACVSTQKMCESNKLQQRAT